MSSDTDDIIDLQISVADKVPEKPNFGVPMLVDYHTAWIDRYTKQYARAADMLLDGFTVNDALYKMALDVKGQNPAPAVFKVGRLATPYTQTIQLIPLSATAGLKYHGVENGVSVDYTWPSSTTLATGMTAIAALIDAIATVIATSDGTKITVTCPPGINVDHSWARGMKVLDATPDPGFAADMALIAAEDSAWYGLSIAPQSKAYTLAAALWTEANGKVFFPQAADWDVLDSTVTTDVASALKALSYTRTAGLWHRAISGTEWAAAAFLSSFLGKDPGAANPAFKQLAGITADDLRSGETAQLTAKNFSRYMRQGGANVTFEGKTPSGRYIDVTRNVDWLDAEVRANIWSVFLNNDVVPYSDEGISLIKGAVGQALKTGQQMKIIAVSPAPIVTVPALADTTSADRAARILRNVEFSARLNGAINRTIVRGSVSV
jgi:hypothetical protein